MTEAANNSNELVTTLVSVVHHMIANPSGGAFNLDILSRFASSISSAQYMTNRMQGAARAQDAMELIDYACAAAAIDGLVVEFGVYSGNSINRIAQHKSGPVYGFDSFEGLPEDWRTGFPKGAFTKSELPPVASNVELVVGWFDRTLPGFLDAHPGPVSLIHIDCDLYSSTQTALAQLRTRIVPGTIILFDEYFNYPGWEMHEYKAFQEFVESWGVQYEYIGLNANHEQVAVRILGIRA